MPVTSCIKVSITHPVTDSVKAKSPLVSDQWSPTQLLPVFQIKVDL